MTCDNAWETDNEGLYAMESIYGWKDFHLLWKYNLRLLDQQASTLKLTELLGFLQWVLKSKDGCFLETLY